MQSDSSHYWFMFVQTRAIHKDPEPLRISGAVVDGRFKFDQRPGELPVLSWPVNLSKGILPHLNPSVLVKVGTEESQTRVFI